MDLLFQFSEGLISEVTLHPLLVHFPIVLFFVFMVFYTLGFFSQKLVSNWINLGILVVLMIISIVVKYTGENAGVEVAPTLVNPRALTNHATHALDFVWSIGALLFSFFIVEFYLIKKSILTGKLLILGRVIVLMVGISTSVLLVKTGHTGSLLVYKYAAGVDVPLRRAEKVIEKHKNEDTENVNKGGVDE